MLKPPVDPTRQALPDECRDFQRRWESGRSHPHLADCERCRSFVEFVDGLRRLGLASPLGDDLRGRLRGVPEIADPVTAFPRVPELPLPAALVRRLRAIARRRTGELPIWIRSPRYAIAASYLLTVLIGGTLGNPALWAAEASGRLETVGSAWDEVQETGRETWRGIGETAGEGLLVSRDYLRTSGSTLRARWLELVDSITDPGATSTPDSATGTTHDGETEASAPETSI